MVEEQKFEAINIEFDTQGDVVIVRLKGYIDSYNAREFQASLIEKVNNGTQNMIINGSGLEYISSAGIGAFMAIYLWSFYRRLREREEMAADVHPWHAPVASRATSPDAAPGATEDDWQPEARPARRYRKAA